MILLVNQHTVPIFTDIANAFAESKTPAILFTGHIEKGGQPLSPLIQLRKSIAYNRKSTLTRFFSWLGFTVHYAFYLLTCRKPEFILVTTNPPTGPIISACIARIRKIPYHILLYDLYPEALFQAGLVYRGNLIFRLWQAINPWVFEGAIRIFTLSESMKNAASIYTTHAEKFRVIHNWADTEYIQPVLRTENLFIERYDLQGKFVVLYAGNMGLTHDLESLILAAEILKDMPNLIFVLIGDGGKRKSLEKLASEKGLDNILFLPYQDEKHFPFAMAAADIGVVTLGLGAEGISVPSKTYVNLAAGVCLLSIAPKNSELSRLISAHEAGVICEPGDFAAVAAVIKLLMADEDRLNHHKKSALKASKFFTLQNAYAYVSETSLLSPVTL